MEQIIYEKAETTGVVEDLRLLSAIGSMPVNAFGNDLQDEFSVTREDGNTQGIFKRYAFPVIPILNTDSSPLPILLPHIGKMATSGVNFEDSLDVLEQSEDTSIKEAALRTKNQLERWMEESVKYPQKFGHYLEQARIFSYIVDRNLATIYASEPLSENIPERVTQLVSRLQLVFGLMGSFYNIEAFVDEKKEFKWNPLNKVDGSENQKGGNLDMVAFLLPAALRSLVKAESGTWNNLNWEEIEELTKLGLSDVRMREIIIEIASIASVMPSDVIFAVNALQSIPAKVGGKKEDFTVEEAQERLMKLLKSPKSRNPEMLEVGRDINALIRFLNWMPSIRGEQNITKSQNWTYSSVCDTADLLLETISQHPELWEDEAFASVFQEQLMPQVLNLDATSSKGRFLLRLVLEERRLKHSLFTSRNFQESNVLYLSRLTESIKRNEWVKELGTGLSPVGLIGGKAFGLEELISNLPIEVKVPRGIVLTSLATKEMMKSDTELWKKILEIEYERDFVKKAGLGVEVANMITQLKLPEELRTILQGKLREMGADTTFAVRSSSSDEDGDINRTGAGTYESYLNTPLNQVENKIKECLSSFFSIDAIKARELSGLSHLPAFGILIQPYLKGFGGVANSRDVHGHHTGVIIEVGTNSDEVTNGGREVSLFTSNGNRLNHVSGNVLVNEEAILNITRILQRIENLKGRDIDLEWVISGDELFILQCRSLPNVNGHSITDESTKSTFEIEITEEMPFDSIATILETRTDGKASIKILGDRDLDRFRGELFTILLKFGDIIGEILVERDIPRTSHFANLCAGLGIRLRII